MAKKKKRKLQPHEKFFVQSIIFGLCIAIFFIFISLPREITYEKACVTVHACNTTGYGRYSRTSLMIVSTDDRILTVSHSEVPFVELRKLLTPGTQVDVEYCHDWLTRLMPGKGGHVTKLALGDHILVQNPPGDQTDTIHLAWLGLPFPLFGFLNWASGEHLLHKWKKRREKERKRRKREEKMK